MKHRILLLPGLGNSGATHWQSHWEISFPHFERVVQDEWDRPNAEQWIARLQEHVSRSERPAVLVAHSLACNLVVRWAAKHTGPVVGAMLVAPSDVEAPSYPSGTTGFVPMPLDRLPFKSIVVASSNDEYVSPGRGRTFAEAWGAEYILLGDRGHIGGAADLGMWQEGLAILHRLAE
jgi:predicted alpha/beta hydrolase family esterase